MRTPYFAILWLSLCKLYSKKNIIGISKIPRIVLLYAKRFSSQERLGKEIADKLHNIVDTKGIAILINATHLCSCARGVKNPSSRTCTTVFNGIFKDNYALRNEFLLKTQEPFI